MAGNDGAVELDRILCPTDFSDFARHALQHAAALARAWDAGLVCLHVMPQTLMHPELFPYLDKPLVPRPEIEKRAKDRLDEFSREATGVVSQCRLVAGDPRLRIVVEARKLSADLIVLGTHGRGGFQRFLLGSVAERVVRSAPGPVLVAGGPPEAAESGTELPYRRILVALDFSKSSRLALDYAVALRQKAGGELLAVHILEPQAVLEPDAARLRIEEVVASAGGEIAEALVLGKALKPGSEIRRLAAERSVDLIVAGSSGASTMGPAEPGFLGSTVHALLRSRGCPVLSVRPRTRTDLHSEEEN